MFDKRLMALCPESKRYIAGNIVFQWLEMMMNAVMIMAVARGVERFRHGEGSSAVLVGIMLIIAVTVAVRFFTSQASARMSHMASRTVKQKLRELIYAKLLRLGNGYRDRVSTAELVQESVEGVDQLESYFGLYVPQFYYAFIAPVTLFFLFGFGGSWATAGVLLAAVPLIPGAIMMVQKVAKKLLTGYWGQYTQLGSTFLENLQGMTTLKTYGADEFKNLQMNEESEKFRFITMKVLTMQLNSIIIMDFFAYGGAAIGILLATSAFVKGKIGLARTLFMILLSAEFFLPMRRLGSYFHVAMNGMAASDRIFTFLNLAEPLPREEIVEAVDPIELDHVSFSYDADREVLHNVCMRIRENTLTGIVGESGSGKSTVASLLTGKIRPGEGMVKISGKDLESISPESLMSAVTYVPHDPTFFKGTVRYNMLFARPGASDEDIWDALEKAELASFLRENGGLEAPLGENAGNLSGGQRQRLALARAILHDTPVYIFDEATSNIDIESEEAILGRIKRMTGTKTVIMISHRLANVTDADVIYCMEDGMVAGRGTDSELRNSCGAYAALWKTQHELENYGRRDGQI